MPSHNAAPVVGSELASSTMKKDPRRKSNSPSDILAHNIRSASPSLSSPDSARFPVLFFFKENFITINSFLHIRRFHPPPMASSASPFLPISVPQNIVTTTTADAAATSAQSRPPIATPAFRAFINHLTDQVHNGLSQRRPWGELVDRSSFSKPESLSEAAERVRKNYSYFRVNYLSLVAVVLGFSLISHPGSLILLLGLLAAWIFLYLFRPSDPPLVLFGRTFSDSEILGVLVVLSVVVVFLTSVGSILISALMVGLAIVCAHAAFRVPEDLFLDEQEPAATGFLSFFGGAAKNAAAAATAPAFVTRV